MLAGVALLGGGLGLGLSNAAPPPLPSTASLGGSNSAAGCLTVAGASAGQQVAQAAYAAGFRGDDLVTAVAISHAESDWNRLATNLNSNASIDYGAWQINTVNAAVLAGGDWRDLNDNAVMAFALYRAAGGFGPWVTFWDGAYRQFVGVAQQAVAGLTSAACTGLLDGSLSDPGPGPQGADGLRPRAANVRAIALARWGCTSNPSPCLSTVGGYAARTIAGTGILSDHATGRAVDLMLPADYRSAAAQDLGHQMANYWASNLVQFGGHYVIFNKMIFTYESRKWLPYVHPSGQRNDTVDHVNHVHISVY
jgi:hypothetical protein